MQNNISNTTLGPNHNCPDPQFKNKPFSIPIPIPNSLTSPQSSKNGWIAGGRKVAMLCPPPGNSQHATKHENQQNNNKNNKNFLSLSPTHPTELKKTFLHSYHFFPSPPPLPPPPPPP